MNKLNTLMFISSKLSSENKYVYIYLLDPCQIIDFFATIVLEKEDYLWL